MGGAKTHTHTHVHKHTHVYKGGSGPAALSGAEIYHGEMCVLVQQRTPIIFRLSAMTFNRAGATLNENGLAIIKEKKEMESEVPQQSLA